MSENVHYLNIFLGIGAILLQIASVSALAILFVIGKNKKNAYLDFIDKHYLQIGFLIALSASVFPLVYSEIVKFAPCYLCWWQRVFVVPAMFIFGSAIWFKERKVVRYVLPIISVGFLITVYHNFNYYFAEFGSTLPCDASGVSCYQQFVYEFGGYISIPMLSLSAFLGILTVLLVAHFYKKED